MKLPLRSHVYSLIPGYTEIDTRIQNAEEIKPRRGHDLDSARALIEDKIRAHLQAGTPIPDELTQEALTAQQEAEALRIVHDAYRSVTTQDRHELESVLDYPGAAPFAALNDELDKLITKARDLIPALNGNHASAKAIMAGGQAIDTWQELEKLTRRYDLIRDIQKSLIRTSTRNFWPMFTSTGLYRNALDISEYFIRRARRSFESGQIPEHLRTIAWDDSFGTEQSWWPASTERTEAFIHIVLNSEPWVPSIETMTNAFSLASRLTSTELDRNDRRAVKILEELEHEYRELTQRP